ncbi:hypothetical protein MF271_02400 (plasmid) [Deinococcus sp. KNUC1210]|uniref:hypothetical protein n=1 Tax=Deinococcus sp. KNUC1210 TaxID=2917691 RepID=UPI001EF01645|nr:hypothetical protein [Deinococcus sp. KNUC1210]ULH14149.1 hypothetical protein MF271_02400 [Deinococcus sp. KNUC1210]
MSDIKNALAQLRAARTTSEDAEVAVPEAGEPSARPSLDLAPPVVAVSEEPAIRGRGEVKTLAGRVPLALHRELTRALLNASEELRVSKINVDEALEAAVRLVLRDPEVTERWHAQLREVRKERRES